MWKRLDDISESDRHAECSLEAVGLWAYILGNTDSCGRRSADFSVMRGKVLTARKDVRLERIAQLVDELSSSGLVHLYDVGGKRYLVMHKVGKRNPPGALKNAEPSCPPPPLTVCRDGAWDGDSKSGCLVFHFREAACSAASTTPPVYVTSPSTSSSEDGNGKEPSGIGGEVPESALAGCTTGDASQSGDPNINRLMATARKAKLRGEPRQIRNCVEGWNQEHGTAATEKLILDNPGKHIWDIEKLLRERGASTLDAIRRFSDSKFGKAKP